MKPLFICERVTLVGWTIHSRGWSHYMYTDLIPMTSNTIGVATAPYRQIRPGKFSIDAELNEAVTVVVRDYNQSKVPDARVSIRNDDVNETLAMTYVRMVAANWSFCSPSTFCLYPALATAGESYSLQSALYDSGRVWLDTVAESFENVHYIKDEIIFEAEYWKWSTTDIVKRRQRSINR